MSTWTDSERESFVLVNQRLLKLYDQAIVKTIRWMRVCFVASVASGVILWKVVSSLPAKAGENVGDLSVAVGGFAVTSLVPLAVMLAIWAAKKRSVVALLVELGNPNLVAIEQQAALDVPVFLRQVA